MPGLVRGAAHAGVPYSRGFGWGASSAVKCCQQPEGWSVARKASRSSPRTAFPFPIWGSGLGSFVARGWGTGMLDLELGEELLQAEALVPKPRLRMGHLPSDYRVRG